VAERGRTLDLFQFAPHALIVTDPGGTIRHPNRAAGRLLGVATSSLIGKPLGVYLGRPRIEPFSRLLQVLRKGRTPRRREFELRTRRATVVPVEVSAIPMPLTDGAPEGFLWILHDVSRRRALEDDLRRLSLRLMTVRDEERRRIALDLHDSMGQNLAALQLQVEIAAQQASGLGEQARRHLHGCLALARSCVAEARTLADVLHPPILDDVGLAAALEWQAHRFAEQTGVRVEVVSAIGPARFATPVEIALFRVAQESLTNAWRHAKATTAEIRLGSSNGSLVLEVEDNGRGIAPEPSEPRTIANHLGVGIAGMRERLSQIGGRLAIETSPGGTIVRAVVGTHALAGLTPRRASGRPALADAAPAWSE
jgi:PAS domain S-box-containing protein